MTPRVRFGAFELDVPAHELRKAGIRLRVPDQSVEILSMLLEHPGEVVPREVIRERLWPNGTVVEFEHSVSAAMNRLRSALGDSADAPKYIETLPKRGYRFIGEVEAAETPAVPPHYRVFGEAGRGGMGIVYRAEDVRLGRTVALKLLPEEMLDDASALERLRREARILASLNHPGICAIYGIDDYEGRLCLVMEWLEGKPLSAIIAQGRPLPIDRVIEVAAQVLDALAAAHAAGVIHRDVKPENIFFTENGKAKLLDFGIAKVAQAPERQGSPTLTETGAVVGTVDYMSPEQVRGEMLDCRTDLFSFGSVLYAIVTGSKPFPGATGGVIQDAILNRTPVPVATLNSDVPRALAAVIDKALQKDPAARYRSAEEMRQAIENVRKTSSAPTAGNRRRVSPRFVWIACAALVTAAVLSVALWSRRQADPKPQPLVATNLTNLPGAEWSPTFSPDGSQVAFVWNGAKQDNADIYAMTVGAVEEQPLRLTSDPDPDLDPAWSPDGRWIAFRRITRTAHEIRLISPLGGGVENKISELPCPEQHCPDFFSINRPSWTPDSRFIAVSDATSYLSPSQIWLVDIATHEKRVLDVPGAAQVRPRSNPLISPDGKTLAFASGGEVYVQELDGLKPVRSPRLVNGAGCAFQSLAWTADARGLVDTCDGVRRISVATGRITPLMLPEPQSFNSVAVSRQRNRLAYSVISSLGGVVENVYRVSRQTGEVSQLFSSAGSHESAQFSNDGKRIVVLRHPEGGLSVCSADGSACRQLTNVGAAGSPRFSPDDRLVAFDAYQSGGYQIFVVPPDGGPARRVAPGVRPTWSRGGTWIYFNCKGGMETLCKVPAAGGEVLEVGVPSGAEAAEGPDGSTLYYIKPGHVGIWAAPATGGAEQRVLDLGSEGKWAMGKYGIYTLSRTGTWAIEYFDLATKKVSRVVRVPIMDRQARQGIGPSFSVSSDEQWFLCGAFERYETDLKLVANFR